MPEVAYEILFAETVQEFMIGLSDRVYNRVRDFVRLIATNPEMGRDYLPEYDGSCKPKTIEPSGPEMAYT